MEKPLYNYSINIKNNLVLLEEKEELDTKKTLEIIAAKHNKQIKVLTTIVKAAWGEFYLFKGSYLICTIDKKYTTFKEVTKYLKIN